MIYRNGRLSGHAENWLKEWGALCWPFKFHTFGTHWRDDLSFADLSSVTIYMSQHIMSELPCRWAQTELWCHRRLLRAWRRCVFKRMCMIIPISHSCWSSVTQKHEYSLYCLLWYISDRFQWCVSSSSVKNHLSECNWLGLVCMSYHLLAEMCRPSLAHIILMHEVVMTCNLVNTFCVMWVNEESMKYQHSAQSLFCKNIIILACHENCVLPSQTWRDHGFNMHTHNYRNHSRSARCNRKSVAIDVGY